MKKESPCSRKLHGLSLYQNLLFFNGGVLDHPVGSLADALVAAHGGNIGFFLDLFQRLFGALCTSGQSLIDIFLGGHQIFLLCDLQEVVRQSDQSMIDALQRIRFGDYTAIEYFSKNARKKPFSSEEGVVYLCVKNRTAERVNDVRVSKLSGQCDLRRDELRS